MDIDYKNFKVGDEFYECEMGLNYHGRVTEAPTSTISNEGRVQWRWKAIGVHDNKVTEYLVTEGFESYGPRIYSQPQYVKRGKDGQFYAPMIGKPDE